jgi:hypothetical protein
MTGHGCNERANDRPIPAANADGYQETLSVPAPALVTETPKSLPSLVANPLNGPVAALGCVSGTQTPVVHFVTPFASNARPPSFSS